MVAGALKLKNFKENGGKMDGKEQRDTPSPSPVIQRKQERKCLLYDKAEKEAVPSRKSQVSVRAKR